MDTINRLQFRHHEEIFETREDALKYICQTLPRDGGDGMAEPGSPYTRSLFAEPTILRYKNDEEEDGTCNGGCNKGPHIILLIGSQTNDDERKTEENKYCIIDIDKTEEEIADLAEELEKAIKSLSIIALSSDTINLYAEKTEDGTLVSGDVKTANTHVFEGVVKENNLMVVPTDDPAGPEGLFIYIDLTYDEATETFTFVVTNADGTLKKQAVKLPNNYLVSGIYKKQDESLHLRMRNGDEVVIDCEELIDEWYVEGEASKTPIVLTREEVEYDGTQEHHHVEPWQDVLRADVRIADDRPANILKKTIDGRYLYVDGEAENIRYEWNGEVTNVDEQLNRLNMTCRVSPDSDNIIRLEDGVGFFANATLNYISDENKLVFVTSCVNGGEIRKEIQLNTVDVIQSITYDPTTEELVIKYVNDKGEVKTLRVPMSGLIDEWTVLNDAHSVYLKRQRNVGGADILTADVNISSRENNILEEVGEGNLHMLYVKGTADNIKYNDTTVEGALDDLAAEDATINEKLDQEIARSTAEDDKIETTIGSGFTTDAHETITYKFEQLTEKVDNEIARSTAEDERIETKLDDEIARSTAKDEEHDAAIADEIARATEAEGNLQDEIEAVSADSANSLKSISNIDKSIDVDNTDAVNPVIKVNISGHDGNTIRLIQQEGAEGLFNFVDLSYDAEHNTLTFTRSTSGTTDYVKEMQLQSISFIDDIYYDKNTEELVIIYHSGHEEKEIRIPLRELIDEWDVYNDTHSAVVLTKEWNSGLTKNILSADVRISDKVDNILENQEGELYVSNSGITANAEAIVAEAERAQEAEAELDSKIDAEISRAENAEDALDSKIDAENNRAEGAETSLNNAINAETARAISAETALQTSINNEVIRATSAETALQDAIDDEEARAKNAENGLTTTITNEVNRATATETRIETALNNEISRAQTKENELNTAITNETLRAQAADNELYHDLSNETAARAASDADLLSKINQESSRAQVAETTISEALQTETNNRENADTNLTNAITAETAARQAKDAELEQMISDATLTFDDTTSIDFTKTTGNVVTADVKLQGGTNIIKLGQGLYAYATLEYEPTGNKIRLVTSDGAQDYIQLVGATLLDSITYDPVNKMLIIKYTDGTGSQRETSVGVTDLWNEWVVQNPSEKSAVEMTKTIGDPGNADTISARVLITDDRDGDGKPDEGSDNLIEIKNNGLYVCGSAMTEAQDIAVCVKNEVKVFEKAVIGHIIGEECGSGYTYEAWPQATYINSATSFNNADFILDQNIKRVEDEIVEVKEDVECVDGKTNAMYKLLYTNAAPMPDCGEGVVYQPYQNACIISGATSFMEADQMLNDAVCGILTMWVSGRTCTTESEWVEDGANRKIEVHTRLSRGNTATMSDDEIIIETLNGDYIDPTRTEFTDTNALRIVCLTEGPSGTTPSVDSMQNGIYLSNVWDCGMYYNEATDADAIAAAQAAGYITDPYRTDTSSSASNYNYNNNVRR